MAHWYNMIWNAAHDTCTSPMYLHFPFPSSSTTTQMRRQISLMRHQMRAMNHPLMPIPLSCEQKDGDSAHQGMLFMCMIQTSPWNQKRQEYNVSHTASDGRRFYSLNIHPLFKGMQIDLNWRFDKFQTSTRFLNYVFFFFSLCNPGIVAGHIFIS